MTIPSDSSWVQDDYKSQFELGSTGLLDKTYKMSFNNVSHVEIKVFQNWICIAKRWGASPVYLQRVNFIYPILRVNNSFGCRMFCYLIGWGGAIAAGESGARGDGGCNGCGYEGGGGGRGDGTGGMPMKHYGGHGAGASCCSAAPQIVPWGRDGGHFGAVDDRGTTAAGGGDGGHFGAVEAKESDFSEEESDSKEEPVPAGCCAAGDDNAIGIISDDDVVGGVQGEGLCMRGMPPRGKQHEGAPVASAST